MIFSKSTEYAIRAMTFLAALPAGRLAGAREISEAEQIPMAFLWKILQVLAKRKLIRSFKGQRGGYELAQPADKLSMSMIVEAIDGQSKLKNCVLGLPACSDENACPLHATWKDLRANMTVMLSRNTLANLAEIAGRRSRKKGK